ncbi:MAG: hypothetical protein AAGD32_01275 [Planctomycetota bacterium]
MRHTQRRRGIGLLSMFFILAVFAVVALIAAQATRLSLRMVQQSRDLQEAATAFDEAVLQMSYDIRTARTLRVAPGQLDAGATWVIDGERLVRGERIYFTRLDGLRFEPCDVGIRLIVGDGDVLVLANAERLRGTR